MEKDNQIDNKSGELINYPAGNLLAHFKRYMIRYKLYTYES